MADESIQLAKLISNLYSEIFNRRITNENVIIKKSAHNIEEIGTEDSIHEMLTASTSIFLWGPSGNSSESGISPMQGRWGEGVWS
ncbi:MAG: hypothetical protein AABY07_08975 [Nanoarchaeota archaeon]